MNAQTQTIHARQHLQTAIEDIQQKILRLASTVDTKLLEVLAICMTKDLVMAKEIITGDKEIDEMQKQIEDECAQTIATEQPVATHLRFFIASIKIAAALERIGDYTRRICQNIDAVSSSYLQKHTQVLQEMTQACSRMTKGAMDVFVAKDVELAHNIAAIDKSVDSMHMQVYRDVVTSMEVNKAGTESSIAFINIIRAIERIGDVVVNICEHTIYVVNGEHVDLN